MFDWRSLLTGRRTPKSDPVPPQLTIEEIDSQIRGLQMMADLREEHRNWRGARICYREIDQLNKQKAALLETPPPAITW